MSVTLAVELVAGTVEDAVVTPGQSRRRRGRVTDSAVRDEVTTDVVARAACQLRRHLQPVSEATQNYN